MTSLVIDILKEEREQKGISAEWDAAVAESYLTTLSQSPWYFAWRDTFAPKEAVIITVRENGRLTGVMPLAKVHTDARGLYLPQVTTFTVADYQVPVVAAGASDLVLPRMVDAAIEHFGKRALYWWANIPTCEAASTALESHLRARGMHISEEFEVAPRLDIAGRSYAEVEATWAPSHRTDVRRQRKRLAAKGPTSLWQPSDLNTARTLLEEFFAVHDQKWLSQGQPGRFQESLQRKHFRSIVDRLWGRGLHLSALRCGDVNVSFGFGFFSGGWVQWYRPTYRHEYQNLSPGKVHIALLVEEACRCGWRGIDFLQGDEGYKLQWSNQQIRVANYYASYYAWSPAYIWFTKGKPYVRHRLGPMYMRTKARLQNASLRLRKKTSKG